MSSRDYVTRDEFNKYLHEIKTYVDVEVKNMETRLTKKITDTKAAMDTAVDRKITDTKASMEQLASTSTDQHALVSVDTRLAELRQSTRELVKVATTQMAEQVYKKVTNELRPQIQNAMEWINYNTQDTDGLVDAYRREVEYRHQGGDQRLLTDGKDKRVISEHVRTFWSEDD